MSDPANALAASSLLLTVLALLYTVWSDSLNAARSVNFSADRDARPAQREPVRQSLHKRAIPLAVACWLAFLVFLPRSLTVLGSLRQGIGSPHLFSDVLAALVVSEVFTLGLAATITSDALAIGKVLRDSWRS